MNYKCVCIISFIFSKFRSIGQNLSFNWRGDSTRLLKLHVPANIFPVLTHSRRFKSLLIFCFDVLNLKLFDFQTAKREGKRELEIATRSSYKYSMWQGTDVRTFKVCLQQRSSKITWTYAWNQLTFRRRIRKKHGFWASNTNSLRDFSLIPRLQEEQTICLWSVAKGKRSIQNILSCDKLRSHFNTKRLTYNFDSQKGTAL